MNCIELKQHIEFTGYHGTSMQNAKSILENGFKVMASSEDWLGHGLYFFIDGISEPENSAFEWSQNTFDIDHGVALEAKILMKEIDILDLRVTSNLKKYNCIREKVINTNFDHLTTRRDLNLKKRKDIRLDDCIITNEVCNIMGYKALIHNVYIKTKVQRELVLESSYPNATVLCIRDIGSVTSFKLVEESYFPGSIVG
jgi:hypothetical protein